MFQSLDQLRQPDDRTLRFTPLGLSLGSLMRPEEAAKFHHQVIAQFDLAPVVAKGTRSSFENLRSVYGYGLFCYEIFTLVNDRTLLVFEQALRERFIEYHNGSVTFVDPRVGNKEHTVSAPDFGAVQAVVKRHRHWRLRLETGHVLKFDGMLHDLRAWARALGLLRGQRNRAVEKALSDLRNLAAHPVGHHVVTPVDAAMTLRDLAEIINHLWGVPTPGGRLYPAPVEREVVVLAWDTAGNRVTVALGTDFSDAADPADQPWQCVIVRAVLRPDQHVADPGLTQFDSLHEVTDYPVDLLWGPGTTTEAAAWFAEHEVEADTCDYLDRTYAIRHDGDDLFLPMRPEVAACLGPGDHVGVWYIVKADHPRDAFNHVRTLLTGDSCDRRGTCAGCHAETMEIGNYETVITVPAGRPRLPPDVATPMAYPRFQRIS